jgi:hypothetical protein
VRLVCGGWEEVQDGAGCVLDVSAVRGGLLGTEGVGAEVRGRMVNQREVRLEDRDGLLRLRV